MFLLNVTVKDWVFKKSMFKFKKKKYKKPDVNKRLYK